MYYDLINVIKEEFGEEMKTNEQLCYDVWSALTNMNWYHNGRVCQDDNRPWGYTFREAGGLISDISEKGNYLSYYCCQQAGHVTDKISDRLAKKGWSWEEM